MEELIGQVTQMLGAVLAAAIVALVGMVARKVGLSISADNQARLEHVVKLGVSYAEEQAKNYAKTYGQAMAAAMKRKLAMEFIVAKIPRVDAGEAERLVQAVLPHLREGLQAGVSELGNAIRTPESPAPAIPSTT